MIKLLLIDFDDTLSLTEEAFFDIENELAASLGFPAMSRLEHQKNWGMPVKEAIAERFPGINPDDFMAAHRLALPKYVESGKVDSINPENIEVLNNLRQSGIKIAILTSRTFHEVEHLLNSSHPINTVVDGFYHADNLEFTKPDPRAFDQPLTDFNVRASESVYVGDSINDGICAKSASMHFIADLESGLRTKADFAKIPVDAFVARFPEIKNYILQFR